MIKLYTVPNCSYCTKAKTILNELGIIYQEINLKQKENFEARNYYRSLGVKTAPIIAHINEDGKEDWIILEFNEDVLREKLKCL